MEDSSPSKTSSFSLTPKWITKRLGKYSLKFNKKSKILSDNPDQVEPVNQYGKDQEVLIKELTELSKESIPPTSKSISDTGKSSGRSALKDKVDYLQNKIITNIQNKTIKFFKDCQAVSSNILFTKSNTIDNDKSSELNDLDISSFLESLIQSLSNQYSSNSYFQKSEDLDDNKPKTILESFSLEINDKLDLDKLINTRRDPRDDFIEQTLLTPVVIARDTQDTVETLDSSPEASESVDLVNQSTEKVESGFKIGMATISENTPLPSSMYMSCTMLEVGGAALALTSTTSKFIGNIPIIGIIPQIFSIMEVRIAAVRDANAIFADIWNKMGNIQALFLQVLFSEDINNMPEKLSIIIDILSAMAFITNELRLWGSYNYGKRLISWSSKNHQSKAEALRGDIERAYSKIYELTTITFQYITIKKLGNSKTEIIDVINKKIDAINVSDVDNFKKLEDLKTSVSNLSKQIKQLSEEKQQSDDILVILQDKLSSIESILKKKEIQLGGKRNKNRKNKKKTKKKRKKKTKKRRKNKRKLNKKSNKKNTLTKMSKSAQGIATVFVEVL